MGTTFDNLCDSCINIRCIFQSGIVRTNCAFYMPRHIDVVMQPKDQYEAKLKADIVDILDKIREEIINPNEMDKLENSNLWQKWFLNLIDKYKSESEDKE